MQTVRIDSSKVEHNLEDKFVANEVGTLVAQIKEANLREGFLGQKPSLVKAARCSPKQTYSLASLYEK